MYHSLKSKSLLNLFTTTMDHTEDEYRMIDKFEESIGYALTDAERDTFIAGVRLGQLYPGGLPEEESVWDGDETSECRDFQTFLDCNAQQGN